MNIRCIIVDDEPPAQNVLERYVREVPYLTLVETCDDALQALDVLNQHPIDLMFLDVQMPKMKGTALLKSLTHSPHVILVTAYPEYALEGFELNVVDYLLKPFSFERFIQAVDKVKHLINLEGPATRQHLLIKSDKRLFKVPFDQILYLQAYGDYVKVFRSGDKPLLTKERLSELEKQLENDHFTRIHRSYIISLEAVQFMEGNMVSIQNVLLPVSASYKEQLLEQLK